MRIIWWMLALGTAVVVLVGCGQESGETTAASRPQPAQRSKPAAPPQELSVTLDGYPGPQNVGFLMADARGYFDEAGLEVSVYTPALPGRPVPYVVDRTVDLSISHLPEVVLAQQRGAPVVAIASVVPRPTAAMIWLEESRIDGIADLKGKTIAVPGLTFQRSFLRSVLGRAGLTLADVQVRKVDYELVPALLNGRADAIFGGSGNVEGAELEARGSKPVVTSVRSLGIPDYEELVLIARRDRLAKDPRAIRSFLSALARGTAAAAANPRAASETILTYDYESIRPRPTEAGVEATLPLLSRSGRMDPAQATQLVAWMRRQGEIRGKRPISALLTNDYVEPSS
jgi:putative hydroxymethylpyrimidine transport system substrate-binding protein